MRMFIVPALAALAFATSAAADPVRLAPISYSPDFQTSLNEDLGAREGTYLSERVTQAVARELAQRGASVGDSGVTIEISIVDAQPNRPTMQQLRETPSLDAGSSVSIGGAELHAVLRSADGAVLSEITHRRFNHSLADLNGPPTTWTEAGRAINQFAEKVADAYVAQAR